MTHQDLKEAMEKATPGPWFNEGNTIWIDAREQVCCGRGGQECCGSPDIIGGQEQIGEAGTADAHFIALANPTRVLALIAEIERLREALESIAEPPIGYADLNPNDLVIILAENARAALKEKPHD